MKLLLSTAAAIGLLAVAGPAQAQSASVGGRLNGTVGDVATAHRDDARVNTRDAKRTVTTPHRTATATTKRESKRAQRADRELDSHIRVEARDQATPVGPVQATPRAGSHLDADPG
jgi:hypothetical protein